MTLEPKHPPIVPSYGTATLADLSASILASLEPGSPEPVNVLGLAPAARACLLIVDGLGWELLRDHPAAAPFLSELARNALAPQGRSRRRRNGVPILPKQRATRLVTPEIVNRLRDEP